MDYLSGGRAFGIGFQPVAGFIAVNDVNLMISIRRAQYAVPWIGNHMFEIQNRAHAIFNTCYVLSPSVADVYAQRMKI